MKKDVLENLLGAAVFLTSLVLYILTLAPGVTFTDAGELAAVAVTLGVAHPTGYPLFTLLAHLWTLLPLPFTAIYKLNLFAAVCTSAAATLFFFLALTLLRRFNNALPASEKKPEKALRKKNKAEPQSNPQSQSKSKPETLLPLEETSLLLIAFAAALSFAFARTVWAQATAIEVYSLHLIMLLLSINFFLRAVLDEEKPLHKFLLWAAVLGLSFANHLTTILLAPAMLFLYFRRCGFDTGSFKRIAWMSIPFLTGLLLYLYLPLRSAASPEFNWGAVHRSVDKFFYHVSGKQFQVWMFDGRWREQFGVFLKLYPYQLAFIGFVPMALGLWRAWRLHRDVFWFLVLLMAGCVGYAINYGIHDIDSYFLLAFIASLLLMAIGFLELSLHQMELAYAAFLIPLLSLTLNYKASDRSGETLVENYTRNLVDNLAPDALLISSQWDYCCSALWYLQKVEGYRPDVVLIEKELLRRTWYLEQLRQWVPDLTAQSAAEMEAFGKSLELFESGKPYPPTIQAEFEAMINSFIDKSIDARPVYLTQDVMQTEKGVATGLAKIPQGLALRLVRENAVPSDSAGIETRFETRFNFAPFLSVESDETNHLKVGIRQTASVGVAQCGRYAAMRGKRDEAQQFLTLALQLDAKNITARQSLNELMSKK